MAIKKYLSLERLQEYDTLIKAEINEKVNANKMIVDDTLSSTSINPVQNKIIDAEFEAISTAMNALESAIDGKSDANHDHNDLYESKEDAQIKYDEITNAKADWSQNDETALDYVKNRTHWEAPVLTTIMPETVLSTVDEVEVDSVFSGTYIVTVDGVSYTCENFMNEYGELCLGDSRLNPIYNGDGEEVPDMSNPMDVPFYISSYTDIELGFFEEIVKAYFIFPDSDTHTVIIQNVGQTEVHPLDEKFIPDTIARISDIPTEITVDSSLSTTSKNPVQNKVIASEINVLSDLVGNKEVSVQIDEAIAAQNEAISNQIDEAIAAIPQTDWNQNDEDSLDYVKNRTHWKETGAATINIFDTYVSISSENGVWSWGLLGKTKSAPVIGTSYMVCYDSFLDDDKSATTYICIAYEYNGFIIIRNDNNPSGDNFSIRVSAQDDGYIWEGTSTNISSWANTHDIYFKVDEIIDLYHPLNENYIPDTIARKSDLDLITVDDIDAICGGAIQYAEDVMF